METRLEDNTNRWLQELDQVKEMLGDIQRRLTYTRTEMESLRNDERTTTIQEVPQEETEQRDLPETLRTARDLLNVWLSLPWI